MRAGRGLVVQSAECNLTAMEQVGTGRDALRTSPREDVGSTILVVAAVILLAWSTLRLLLAMFTTVPIQHLEAVISFLAVWVGCAMLLVTLIGSNVEIVQTSNRRSFRRVLLWVAPSALLWVVTATLDSPARAVRRAEPIVDAIARFVAAEGQPPAELSELVPHYLNAVPLRVTRTFEVLYTTQPSPPGWNLTVSGEWLDTYDEYEYAPGTSLDTRRPGSRRIGPWRGFHDD